ncbi:MAG TPA: efflux RND transporter periplasmic adaptor subunit [Candidatus Acidoferrales bacterium]|nr:efflux RND transporter periplasmic adaptor subunit [Candidatus Acidoferrales bacterium]
MSERAPGRRRRWVGWLIGVIVVVALVLVLANRDQAPEVQVAQVRRENLSASIASNGKVEPIQPSVARAQFVTFVDNVRATEGQTVHKGEVILVLNADDAKAQLANTRAELLVAQEQLRSARAGGPADQLAQINGDLRKAQINLAGLQKTQNALKQLVAEKAATQDELDQNASKVAQAQATVATLEQQKAALAAQANVSAQSAGLSIQRDRDLIATLMHDVNSATVVAPLNGTLYSLPVHSGDYVQVGQVLAQMADLHFVRVRAFVDEPDLGVLAPNQPVDITWDALPGRVWTGRTETVPKQVTTLQLRSVGEVLCSVANNNLELIPNINVDVKIEVSRRQNTLVVPRGAVHTDGSKHYVLVVDDNTLHRRDVDVGIANPTEFEVISGLKDGERVALSGDITLRDGMNVHPAEVKR